MADALRQKATEAYLDDDFVSAIEFFKQASCGFCKSVQASIMQAQ